MYEATSVQLYPVTSNSDSFCAIIAMEVQPVDSAALKAYIPPVETHCISSVSAEVESNVTDRTKRERRSRCIVQVGAEAQIDRCQIHRNVLQQENGELFLKKAILNDNVLQM